MPVKIKNRLTEQVMLVNLEESKRYESDGWDVVARKGIIQVFQPNILQNSGRIDIGEFEKEDVVQLLKDNESYKSRNVVDWGDWNKIKVTKNDLSSNHFDDLFSIDKQNSIIATEKHPIAMLINRLTLADWAAIFTIIGAIATVMALIVQIKSSNNNIQIFHHIKK